MASWKSCFVLALCIAAALGAPADDVSDNIIGIIPNRHIHEPRPTPKGAPADDVSDNIIGGNAARPEPVDDLEDKIIGGEEVRGPGIFPHQVSVQYYKEERVGNQIFSKMAKFCGGTIIAKNLILTAAHCINKTDPQYPDMHINCGVEHAFCYDGNSQLVKVKEAIVHPHWDTVKTTNDVALLVLAKDLVYTHAVQPAKLPSENYTPSGYGVITGWGKTGDLEKDRCYKMQYAVVPITNYQDCKKQYWPQLNTDNLCVGSPGSTNPRAASSCGGDSGGPLVTDYNSRNPTVVGICSFGGMECEKYPSAYVNVKHHLDWIKQHFNRYAHV